MAYEPAPNQYQKEHRYQFSAQAPAGPRVVLSGYVVDTNDALGGNPDDDHIFENHEVYLTVGPWWRDVPGRVDH